MQSLKPAVTLPTRVRGAIRAGGALSEDLIRVFDRAEDDGGVDNVAFENLLYYGSWQSSTQYGTIQRCVFAFLIDLTTLQGLGFEKQSGS